MNSTDDEDMFPDPEIAIEYGVATTHNEGENEKKHNHYFFINCWSILDPSYDGIFTRDVLYSGPRKHNKALLYKQVHCFLLLQTERIKSLLYKNLILLIFVFINISAVW